MAEVLGIAASGIAVAQAAGETARIVLKLKRLWDDIQDVPESIQDLMEQIDYLGLALSEAEEMLEHSSGPSLLSSPSNRAAQKCLDYYRKSWLNLSELVDELSVQINSNSRVGRRLGRLKFVLKKEQFRTLERRLRGAVSMLQLAQQFYLAALTRSHLHPETIAQAVVAQLESHVSTIHGTGAALQESSDQSDPITTTSANPNSSITAPRKTQSPKEIFKLKSLFGRVALRATSDSFSADVTPSRWLAAFTYTWGLDVAKSYSGWKMHLRIYPRRPLTDPIFDAVRNDDVQSVQSMFSNQTASPFDCCLEGTTLILCTIQHNAVKCVKLLIEMGIDPRIVFLDYPINVLFFLANIDWMLEPYNIREGQLDMELDIVDVFASHCSLLEYEIQDWCQCPVAALSWEAFRLLQPVMCPAHDRTSIESRLYKASHLSFSSWVSNIKAILNPDWETRPLTVCNHPPKTYFSLMHTVAIAIAGLSPWFWSPPTVISPASRRIHQISTEQRNAWISFAREVTQNTNDRHLLVQGSTFKHWFRKWLRWNDQVPRMVSKTMLYTPFVHLFMQFHIQHCWFTRAQLERHRHQLLVQWIRIIKDSGEDLVDYGDVESLIIRDPDLHIGRSVALVQRSSRYQRYDFDGFPFFLGNRHVWYIIGFKYGPKVSDWAIWWNEPTDEFAGDFWKLIEDPPCYVPGQWVEEEKEYDLF